MEQTFGSYIRQKRQEKSLKLNAFAKQVGISNVYLSYIESGKRPAPSQLILLKISEALGLSPEETDRMYILADLSRRQTCLPEDVWDYIAARPYVIDALRWAARNGIGKEEWESLKTEMIFDQNKGE